MIRTKFDKSSNLTVEICIGKIDIVEVSEKIKEFYESGPTMNVLWDLSEADTSGIETGDVKAIADLTVSQAHSRKGGKTAIVSPKAIAFGLSRMFQSFAEMAEHQAQVQIFRSLDEAKRWIES